MVRGKHETDKVGEGAPSHGDWNNGVGNFADSKHGRIDRMTFLKKCSLAEGESTGKSDRGVRGQKLKVHKKFLFCIFIFLLLLFITPQAQAQPTNASNQIISTSTSKSSGLQKIEVGINPSIPTVEDNISLKVELTYSTAGYIVEFGEVSIQDKAISVNIKTRSPSGMAAQVITTYSHVYNLGYLSEGSYVYTVILNNISIDMGAFEVVSIKSQQITPGSTTSSATTKAPVKTPGFNSPMELILIYYIVLKIKFRSMNR